MKRHLLLTLLTALFLSGVSYSQKTNQKIDELLSKYHEYGLFNGTALAAKEGKIILSKGYGFANYEFNAPNKPETKFRIGSISKQFTAAVIMKLVEEGKIKLDGKITDYLKDYRKDTGEKVTIRNLLNHTSGIKSYTDMPGVWKDSLRNHYEKNYFIKHFHSGDLQFEPGAKFAYNNSGYYLLAAIAEEVAGKSFEKLFNEIIIKPAGLSATGVESSDETAVKKLASGYLKKINKYQRDPYIYMPNALGAGSVYSTVEDMFKWDAALRENKVISDSSKKAMLTPKLSNYGFGWIIIKSQKFNSTDSVTVITHGGGINGFNTLVMSSLEDYRYAAVFNNTGIAPLGEIARKIMNILDGKEVEFPKKPIKDYLYEVINDEGIETALENYRRLKEEEEGLFDFSESQLNTLGYILLNDKRLEEAIAIFKLNVEIFPNSSNVYDSMAEAFMKKGDDEKAVEYYKKSLELNPGNNNAVQMLKELGAEPSTDSVELKEETLKRYAGEYILTPNFTVKIRVDGNRIFAKATSQAEFEIFPMNKTKFYYKVVNAQIEFLETDGKIDRLTLYQNGRELPAKKIK